MAHQKSPATFPWGEVLFPLGLIAVFLVYARSVYADARGVTDWLLILPASLLGAAALLVIVILKVMDWRRQQQRLREPDGDAPAASGPEPAWQAVAFMGLLALFVAMIPQIGFDIGSFLFLCAALRLQGEKRWWVLFGFSTVVAGIIVYVFVELLGVRMPTLLF
jgi:cytochrome c oxidase subunit IV